MDLLAAGYGSGSDDDSGQQEAAAPPPVARPAVPQRRPQGDYSDDTSGDSSDESVDSATLRAAEAAARLRDFGEGDSATSSGRRAAHNHQQQQRGSAAAAPKSFLPSALDVLGAVEGPPRFLDPEAIRPLASASTHGAFDEGPGLVVGGGGRERQAPGRDFDISRLAPPLKGQVKEHADKREAPPGAVIEGRAKRYKPEDGPEATQQYSAAVIAMMGGKVAEPKASGPTKPMEVSEFLDKGHGAAQLPRKNADRKEKEKEKRGKGQSTHSHWKSEAEMVLRQQFDS